MAMQSTLQFAAVPPANVPNPAAGYYSFFVSDGSSSTTSGAYYKKDSAGTVTALIPAAYSDENAQDAVGNILTDSATIDFTYDDSGNTITAIVKANSIDTAQLLDNAVTLAKMADNSVGTAELIAANVTNAKLANMASATFKGQTSGGSGAPVDLSASQAKTALAVVSTDLSDFTEAAQDAVGNALVDGTTIDFTYNDGANTITAERAALTGDVTASLGSNATTIAADAVTNAKAANMTASTIKGQIVGGSGDPVDLTQAQVVAVLNPGVTPLARTGLPVATVTGSAGTVQSLGTQYAVGANAYAVGDVLWFHYDGVMSQTTTAACVVTFTLRRTTTGGSIIAGTVLGNSAITVPLTARTNLTFSLDCYLTVKAIGAGGTVSASAIYNGPFFAVETLTNTTPGIASIAFDTTAAHDLGGCVSMSVVGGTGVVYQSFIRKIVGGS